MKELLDALNPFPLAQGILIGLVVAAGGFWAVRRGLQDSRKRDSLPVEVARVHIELSDEEKRLEWIAYEQLENIEKNSFKMAELLKSIAEAVNRLADNRWNSRQ